MTQAETFLDGRLSLYAGDCIKVLADLPENSVDSCVCDPPYHLASIVKRFGAGDAAPVRPGKTGAYVRASKGFMGRTWDGGDIAFRVETWAAVLRVLKPGAYIVAFSSSRTFGRMSVAIEDAGFITHPLFGWIFGQGFPKAHKVHAEGWEGWRYGGQACKPALEPVYMGQKPFSEKTGTANVLKWGTGALNIEGCRVEGGFESGWSKSGSKNSENHSMSGRNYARDPKPDNAAGRWPANVITDGSEEVAAAFPNLNGSNWDNTDTAPSVGAVYGNDLRDRTGPHYDDSGSAARFFYAAKADTDDRLGSKHPTVKPLDLMQYLVRLVTPPNGLVLDCFAGTGTTGEAAYRGGHRAILIEAEPEYQADIRRRCSLILSGPGERGRESIKARGLTADAGPLFADNYDADKDFAASLDVGYAHIRDRVAAGGPGWTPGEGK